MASNLRFIKNIIDENIPLIICTVSCICEFKTRSGKDVVDFDCQAQVVPLQSQKLTGILLVTDQEGS